MQVHWFDWFISGVNFLVFALAFNFIVIEPMQRAVKERGERVKDRFKEIEGLLEEARNTRAKYEDQAAGLEVERNRLKDSADREVARVVGRIEEKAEAEAEHLLEKARTEAEMLRIRATTDIREQMARQAVERAREMLTKSLDKKAHRSILEQAVKKVGTFRAS